MLPHTTTFGNPDYRCPRKIAAKPTLTLYVKYVGKQALEKMKEQIKNGENLNNYIISDYNYKHFSRFFL